MYLRLLKQVLGRPFRLYARSLNTKVTEHFVRGRVLISRGVDHEWMAKYVEYWNITKNI